MLLTQSRFPNSRAWKTTRKKWGFTKKIPKKKQKVIELYFNEYDGTVEIDTYNIKRKKHLTAYAATYPDLCKLIDDDENGGLRFEIDKHWGSI